MSTIDEVFGYVMDSPENTNPAVLRSLLNGADPQSIIDDSAASQTKTYSSSKIEELTGGTTVIMLNVSDSSISIDNEMEFEDIVELVLSGENVVFRQVVDTKIIGWNLNQAFYIDIMGNKTYHLNLYAVNPMIDANANFKVSIANFSGSKTATLINKEISYNV